MKLANTIARLKAICPNKWHIHEKVLCVDIGLKPTESVSYASQLPEIVIALRKGFKGSKRKGTLEMTEIQCIDLGDTGTPNPLNIHYCPHGSDESFPADALKSLSMISRQPRYFSFGPDTVEIKMQLSIVKLVIGEDSTLDEETAKRHQQLWKGWYLKEREACVVFERDDLPVIVQCFPSIWNVNAPPSNDQPMPRDVAAKDGVTFKLCSMPVIVFHQRQELGASILWVNHSCQCQPQSSKDATPRRVL